jgi:hypothetical protein
MVRLCISIPVLIIKISLNKQQSRNKTKPLCFIYFNIMQALLILMFSSLSHRVLYTSLTILLFPLVFLLSNSFMLVCFPTIWLWAYLIKGILERRDVRLIKYPPFLFSKTKQEFKMKKTQVCFIYHKRKVIVSNIYNNSTNSIKQKVWTEPKII